MTSLVVQKLGLLPYREAWEVQKELQQRLIKGEGEDTLLLCEHPPVITLGRSAKPENVLASEAELAKQNVEVIPIERGGDVTFHGPGQLVAYPIIDLTKKRQDVGWYMRAIEEVIIRTLARFDIEGVRIPGKTGVWISRTPEQAPTVKERKIASLGVRISRWKTLHGFSINVLNSKQGFSLINPCGFADIEVTSIEEESSRHSVSDVGVAATEEFCKVFDYVAKV